MAPTEILAEQHLQTIRDFLGGMDLRVELLTGIVKGKQREQILAGLADGSVDIIVGTHALIEDNVIFRRLGLAVVDEQHRYGDLDVSVIDELPPGRKPIVTRHYYDNQLSTLFEGMRRQIRLGRQVYVVYPLIDESAKLDLKNLEEGYGMMQSAFPDCHVSRVHGKMKPQDKEQEMQRFVSGETQILVSTTVIEVGVNVPNASVMVIMDAQRFGLSQLHQAQNFGLSDLHQLRGRVGRGADQSYCILVTNYKLSEETRKRIDIMCDTNDGFRIAEADLKLRGPGDLEGTQQSGMGFDLKIANIARDGQFVQLARDEAQRVIDADPTCTSERFQMLWKRLKELRKTNINWGAIS